ncbi:MAG: hypothetical protein EOO25_21410 [Comamonadaceae bacterium]|nr:MAG: hypothetical protein EOO25_21410 [Comamonadaceae bacterium]
MNRFFNPLQLGIDAALLLAAWWAAFWLRFNLDVPDEFIDLALAGTPWCLGAYAVSLMLARVYRQVWNYTGLPELRQLTLGIMLGALLTTAGILMLRMPSFPRSVLVLHPLIALVLLGAVRAAWRTLAERRLLSDSGRRLIIIGPQQWQPVGWRPARSARWWRRRHRPWMRSGPARARSGSSDRSRRPPARRCPPAATAASP